jgi:hypothetical protein
MLHPPNLSIMRRLMRGEEVEVERAVGVVVWLWFGVV